MTPLERLGLEVVAFRLLGGRVKAATLCALLDANGNALDSGQLAAVRPWGVADAAADPRNVVKTRICVLREALEDVGIGDVIRTLGDGRYAIAPRVCERVILRLTGLVANCQDNDA